MMMMMMMVVVFGRLNKGNESKVMNVSVYSDFKLSILTEREIS